MKAAAHPSAAEAAARAFAEDLAVLLERGLMEIDGIPIDDASPRFAPTAAGRAEAEGDGHEKGRRRVLTIQLFTRAGERIHTATIPDLPDDEAPDVIVWGTRLFVVPQANDLPDQDEDLTYIEALVFALPAPPAAPTLWGQPIERKS